MVPSIQRNKWVKFQTEHTWRGSLAYKWAALLVRNMGCIDVVIVGAKTMAKPHGNGHATWPGVMVFSFLILLSFRT